MSTVLVRRLTLEDTENVQSLDIGTDDDFVLRTFPHLLNEEILYGAFDRSQLLGVGSYRIVADNYAVLQRLRVSKNHRGEGIGTRIESRMAESAESDPRVTWTLGTIQGRKPMMERIMQRLGRQEIATYYSCLLATDEMEHVEKSDLDVSWAEIKNPNEKRRLFLNSRNTNPLGMLPYKCYYPLPLEPGPLTDDYLDKCRVWGDREAFFATMPDGWQNSYLHLKYLGDDIFQQHGLWRTAIKEARKNNQAIWIDMSSKNFEQIPNKEMFSTGEPWHMWGKRVR